MVEKTLNEIINETIYDVINRIGTLNEMAIPLKDYKSRVNGLRFQLVENWCLCKWWELYNPNCGNFKHWLTELKAAINNLKFLDIKNGIDKKKLLKRMLIQDYDYNKPNMIERIIRDKFNSENIKDNGQKDVVCNHFANHINDLIEVISNDKLDTYTYLKNNFINID